MCRKYGRIQERAEGWGEDAELGLGVPGSAEPQLGVCRSMSSSFRFTEAHPAVLGSSGSFRHEVADDVSEIVGVQRFQQAFGHQGNGGDLRLVNIAERHGDGFGQGL